MNEYINIYLNILGNNLKSIVAQTLLLLTIISAFSIITVEAIKRIFDKAFSIKINKIVCIIMSLVVNSLYSFFVVFFFDGLPNWWSSVIYASVLSFISFFSSSIMYDYLVKDLFILMEASIVWAKKVKTQIQVDFIKVNTLLLLSQLEERNALKRIASNKLKKENNNEIEH